MKLPGPTGTLETRSQASESAASVRPHNQSLAMSSSVRSGSSFRSKSAQWPGYVLYLEQNRDSHGAVAIMTRMSLMLDPDSSPGPSHSAAPFVASASAIGREAGLSVSADR
jgi:hypothetical protein